MMPSLDLQKMLAGAQLPALPQSAIRLLELSQDPNNGPAEFAVPIESDPGLAGQVLRFVNSSYFGFSREISSVKLAITLVGIRTIKNFALWSAVFSLMPNPRCGPFELKSLWQDSLRRALMARTMGKRLGMKEAEDLFAAALLQDMSVPLLAKEAPEIYIKLLKARNDGRVRLSDLEQETFGWTHAHAAGLMARQWNLPESLAGLVEDHTQLDRWLQAPNHDLGRLSVAMSALLPATSDSQWNECAKFEACYQSMVSVDRGTVEGLLQQTDEEFTEFAPTMKLAKPRKSLVDCYHEVAVPTQ
jgi:HD-like signal output (HDOD) protein